MRPVANSTASKQELQRKLNLPRRGGRRRDRPGRGAIGVAGTVTRENHLVRVRETGVVENIEELGPELQHEALAKMHVLEGREVQSLKGHSRNLRRRTT